LRLSRTDEIDKIGSSCFVQRDQIDETDKIDHMDQIDEID